MEVIAQKLKSKLRKYNKFGPAVIIFTSLICVILIQGTLPQQPFDDAFITFRYARNISKGLGFVYNQGEKVLGTTTPLYTLLLAFISYLSNPDFIPQASFIISVVADVINLVLLFRISNWIFKDRVLAILTSLIFLLQPFRLSVAAGGMETSLFITCLLFVYDRYFLGERSFSTAFWAASAILIRPDAVIALIPLFVDWFFHDRQRAIKGASITFAFCIPWILWATFYFGSPIPHSIVAKSISYKNPLGHALFYMLTFIGTGTPGPYSSLFLLLPGVLLALPVAIIGLRKLGKHKPRGMVMGFYPILYILIMSIFNPAMYFSWYFLPLMPGMLILLTAAIWFGLKDNRKWKLIIASAVSIILLAVPFYLLISQPNWPLSRAREAAFWKACNSMSNNSLDNKVVLTPDIGVLGWCLEEAKILDPIGLVSPEVIEYNRGLAPDQLISPLLIREKRPDYIITLDQFINPGILEDGYFQKSYKIIFNTNVKITETTQPLYIFQLDQP